MQIFYVFGRYVCMIRQNVGTNKPAKLVEFSRELAIENGLKEIYT